MKLKAITAAIAVFCLCFTAQAEDSIQGMFSNGSLKGEIRLFDFTRNFDGSTTDRNDMAAGGLFYYNTAAFKGVSFGAAFATANDVASDDNDAVYGLLQNDGGDHESFTRLQEYYIQGGWFDTRIRYGAQELFTPLMNGHDVRMAPRTYRGLSVVNSSLENLTLSFYYITDSMGHSDEDFISLSEAVANEPGGASAIDDDKDMLIFAASYDIPLPSAKANVQAWYYTMEDVYREIFLKGSISKKFSEAALYANPSILFQKSHGDELNGELDTNQYGLSAGVKAYGFDLTGYYAKTGDDSVFLPWGDEKTVVQQVMSSTRAEEDVYGIKLAYDFGRIGLKGLNAYVYHAEYIAPDSGKNQANDIAETDFSIQYLFSGSMEGLGLRARYASINVKEGGEDYEDIRFMAVYKFAMGKK